MKVNVHGKDVDVSPKTIDMISEKLAFLDRYLLIDENSNANAIVKKVGERIKIEITILTKVGLLRAEVVNDDLKKACDEAVERLQAQLTTQKNRLNRRHKDKLAKTFVIEDEDEIGADDIPVRTKTIDAETMDLEEAILQMEMLGHSFFIYRDSDSELISVVYARHDGGYGLIEVDK